MNSYNFRMKLAIFQFFKHGAGQFGVTNTLGVAVLLILYKN